MIDIGEIMIDFMGEIMSIIDIEIIIDNIIGIGRVIIIIIFRIEIDIIGIIMVIKGIGEVFVMVICQL